MNSKIFKYIELILIFIGIPLLYRFRLIPGHKIVPLLIVFILCLIWLLWKNKEFDRKKFGINAFNGWKYLLIRSVVAAILIFTITLIVIPQSLFYLPRKAFLLWVIIMVFYPLWSAYPQELIYRTFFFERYKDLFTPKWIVIVNSLLFGFLHIIFGNWVAVLGATIIGFVFSITYSKHQSLLTVAIEHAIIGDIVFTIGLGQYFYVPDF